MESLSKIQQFQQETGASAKDAKVMLQGAAWDVEAAVKSYKFLQVAARPPAGPQKNQEPPVAATNKTATVTLRSSGGGPSPGGGTGGLGLSLIGGKAAQGVKAGVGQVMPPGDGITAGDNTSDKTVSHTAPPLSPASLKDRRLMRGLSKTTENIHLVNKARDIVLGDIVEDSAQDGHSPNNHTALPHFVETPEYTFILPDLTRHPADFRAFLHKDLIETSTLVSLEQAGRLNWWADIGACQRLLPLATTGDGNCLLHAASLGMWGFHDRLLTLRKALHSTLTNTEAQGALWRRWRWHQTLVNKMSGLIFDEKEWASEWRSLLKLASIEPRTAPGQRPASCCDSPATKGMMERETSSRTENGEEVFYESLEELHVFVLAHVLRRPIIVVADTILKDSNGDALAPIPFGGIYLPLECNPSDCHRSPLLLTYDAAHFSALVPMEETAEEGEEVQRPKPAAAIPLVDPEFKLLPIHFMVDPGPHFVWGKDDLDLKKLENLELATEDRLNVISKYLELERVLIPQAPSSHTEDEEEDEEGRPRSNSWTSSGARSQLIQSASMESAGSNNGNNAHQVTPSNKVAVTGNNKDNVSESGSNKKDSKSITKEAKDKTRMSKQMQSMAKSFGSIGRSMSKKIKKNFGGITVKIGKDKSSSKASTGTVTQSTKTSVALSPEVLRDKRLILCAKLLHKRLEYQQEMMDNYLTAAMERFQQDRDLRRLQDEEMRQKAQLRRQHESTPQACITPDCEGTGTAATSYLCPKCYEEQKSEALQRQSQLSQQPLMGSGVTVRQAQQRLSKWSPTELHRQNTLVTSGNSRFYTYADEDHNLEGVHPDSQQQALNNLTANKALNNQNLSTTVNTTKSSILKSAPVALARSSFYDESLTVTLPEQTNSTVTPAVVRNNLGDTRGFTQHRLANPEKEWLAAQHTTQYTQSVEEPPLRPAFAKHLASLAGGGASNSLKTKSYGNIEHEIEAAIREQCSINGGLPLEGKYVTKVNVNMKGQDSHKSSYKDPQMRCVSQGCDFYGSELTDFLCSRCYRERQRTLSYIQERQTAL